MSTHPRGAVAWVATTGVLVSACFTPYEPSGSATGSTSTGGGQGGGATSSGTGAGGTGEGGGPCDPNAPLRGSPLLRYFLDNSPESVTADASPNALDLNIDDGVAWDESVDMHTGLRWSTHGDDAKVISSAGSFAEKGFLEQARITLEVVVDIESVHEDDNALKDGSRILYVGPEGDEHGALALSAYHHDGPPGFALWARTGAKLDAQELGRWAYDWRQKGRLVVQATLVENSKATLHVNKQLIVGDPYAATPSGAVRLDTASWFVLGNRPLGERSLKGLMTYAAIYGEALSEAQRNQNADRLSCSDDGPHQP